MNTRRPLILITNDDGYQAKGINELVKCLRSLGEIVVFAPDGPRSGMGSAITGTPVDCVKLAINEILDAKHDLLFSGINH